MREYLIDELSREATGRLEELLRAKGMGAGLDHLYWLEVGELSPLQKEHASCGPHVAALEVEETRVRLELLIRGRNTIRCDCIAWAGPSQVAALVTSLHELVREAGIDA